MTIDERATKWLVLALLASLAVNLFLAGLMVGRLLRSEPERPVATTDPPGRRSPLAGVLRQTMERLPPKDRKAFRAALEEHRESLRAASLALAEARIKVRWTLQADAYDPIALNTAFSELKTRSLTFQDALHTAVADAMKRLPPKARRGLAE